MNDEELPWPIPTELLPSIFAFLPVKSLIRFLSVSKSLNSEIRSSTFLANHAKHSVCRCNPSSKFLYNLAGQNVLTFYTEDETPFLVREFPQNRRPCIDIIDSRFGVLCLKDFMNDDLMLWNPLISKSVQLPPYKINIYLGVIGFGYDPINNDYKVVVVGSKNNGQPASEIYTLCSKTWRTLENPPPRYFQRVSESAPAYVNGSSHWLVRNPGPNDDEPRYSILSFHMGDESFKELGVPLGLQEISERRLVVSKELLCLVPYHLHMGWRFDVWTMKEYGKTESWVKLFNINFKTTGIWKLLGIKDNGEILLADDDTHLFLVNRNTRETRKLGFRRGYCYLGAYMESLALLNEKDGKCSKKKKAHINNPRTRKKMETR